MLQVAICDDEILFQRELAEKIRVFSQQSGVEFEVRSFSTSEQLLKEPFNYDILFLDISLENGEDGIELGKCLREKGNHAVFILVSSHSDRYQDGYYAEPLRYLTKPVQKAKLEEAINTAIRHLQNDRSLLEIKFDGMSSFVEIKNIMIVESYNRKRYVHTKGKKYETTEQWLTLLEKLPKGQFYGLQRCIAINLEQVIGTSKTQVTMSDNSKYNIPKGRYGEFNRAFLGYLGGLK